MNLTLGSNTTTSSNQGYQIFANNEQVQANSTQIFAAPSVDSFGGESAGSIAFGGESAGSIASLGSFSSVSSFSSFSSGFSSCSSSCSSCSYVA